MLLLIFYTVYSLCILYTTPVRPKLEYAPAASNSITLTDLFNSKEFKENLPPYVIADLLWEYAAKIIKYNNFQPYVCFHVNCLYAHALQFS
jgi:hypothetical protein